MGIDEDFLNLLVKETYDNIEQWSQCPQRQKKPKSPFQGKLAKPIERYLKKNSIQFLVGKVVHQVGCLRFSWNNQNIDFPLNWSIFARIPPRQYDSFEVINKNTNPDQLLEILSKITQIEISSAFFYKQSQDFYFILFEANNVHAAKQIRRLFINEPSIPLLQAA